MGLLQTDKTRRIEKLANVETRQHTWIIGVLISVTVLMWSCRDYFYDRELLDLIDKANVELGRLRAVAREIKEESSECTNWENGLPILTRIDRCDANFDRLQSVPSMLTTDYKGHIIGFQHGLHGLRLAVKSKKLTEADALAKFTAKVESKENRELAAKASREWETLAEGISDFLETARKFAVILKGDRGQLDKDFHSLQREFISRTHSDDSPHDLRDRVEEIYTRCTARLRGTRHTPAHARPPAS